MSENLPVIVGVSIIVLAALAINPSTRPLVRAMVNVVAFIPKLISFAANIVILLIIGAAVYLVATNLPALTRLVDGIHGLARLLK